MTWTNRLRLFGGILGVLLVVAALTLVFNQRQIKVTSLDATVATDTYDVGAAYGGTVTKQFVNEGGVVAKGELFHEEILVTDVHLESIQAARYESPLLADLRTNLPELVRAFQEVGEQGPETRRDAR